MTLPWYPPEQRELDWLRSQGVSDAALDDLPHIGAAFVEFDGHLFEEVEDGQRALTFVIHGHGEFIDFAAWQPRTGQLATWRSAGFAIGQEAICNPATYFAGGALRIHRSPLEWLKADRDGIVIADHKQTYAMLRHVPRLSFADAMLARQVRAWLQPPKPRVEFLVEVPAERAAA
jgi:hypothetical protein